MVLRVSILRLTGIVQLFLKPGLILFWGDYIPLGSEWWNRTLLEVPNIYYIYAPPVYELGGHVVELIQHKADFLRLDFLYSRFFVI